MDCVGLRRSDLDRRSHRLKVAVLLEFAMVLAGAPATVAYYLQNKAALDAAGAVSIVNGAAHIAAHLDERNADPL